MKQRNRRRAWRCLVTCSIALLIAVAGMVAGRGPAAAAMFSCDTPASNYFTGYYHDPTRHTNNFEGASGYIISTDARTCGTDSSGPDPGTRTIGNNFTTSWVMIAD